MISDTMTAAINEQINRELYSSYLYLQMAAHFDSVGLAGFAQWMKVQAQEEIAHAMIFYNYVNERGGKIILATLDAPPADYASPLEVFTVTLKHEELVTSLINDLVDTALNEKDYATRNRLEWFVAEQVEEESNAMDIIGKLKLVGDQGDGLFMVDQELGARVFAPPAALAGGA